MPVAVTIDQNSGFCFGVVSAIREAEKQLARLRSDSENATLYCLGEIVHNNEEVKRLEALGLRVIDKEAFTHLEDADVLIRAHGEPPQTYRQARQNRIHLIDATCPIVLRLQQRIKAGYEQMQRMGGQVLIYGKAGHAEVIGLNGQTGNRAQVVSSLEDLRKNDFSVPTLLYAQTTMNADKYLEICRFAEQECARNKVFFQSVDSICKSMSRRASQLEAFSREHDCVVFVSGRQSSNGRYLYDVCKRHNDRAFFITSPLELRKEDFEDGNGAPLYARIGICGATSTPMWLMEAVAERIKTFCACI
ncbi:MAG: 4-hydroxy-3-methylbut-2-enyl diphosphate reductase [Bacteroidales bacterium]|nr:4-hydroxy-3-methylbut-2-enyl diphosphate reductase [Bacteroidales bacterium]